MPLRTSSSGFKFPLSALLIIRALTALFFTTMPASAQTVFIGAYSDSIQAAAFDSATGKFGPARAAAPVANASFLAKSPDGRFLYAVAEGRTGALHAFAIGADDTLAPLNTRPSEGPGPCDIAVSPDALLVAAANYSGGSVVVYALADDGSLGDKVAFFQNTHASNAHPDRQKKPHAHGVTWSPDGRLLLVPDLGGDRVYIYSRDLGATAVTTNLAQPWLDLPPSSGPRHAQFSPDGQHLYIINELANTVAVVAFDPAAATLAIIEIVPTLPADFTGQTKTAEIVIHPAGHTVYASNRGHDSLAVFARDPATGRLSARGHVSVPKNPRHFALSPDARWLLSAGQDADRVAVFAVSPADGRLIPHPSDLATPKPVCVRF
jgi:6-phosphogluconolactonase